jgi:hypothetical protein
MALTSDIDISLVLQATKALDLATVSAPVSIQVASDLTSGTGVDQADKVWHDRRTLATLTEDLIDLAGSLTDAFGDALTFAKVKVVYVRLRTTTAGGEIQLGGTTSNGVSSLWSAANDGVKIGAGGFIVLVNPSAAGYAVTAATADILRVYNASAFSVDYDIIIAGTSA